MIVVNLFECCDCKIVLESGPRATETTSFNYLWFLMIPKIRESFGKSLPFADVPYLLRLILADLRTSKKLLRICSHFQLLQ